MSEYQERDIINMDIAGNYYGRHIMAMTKEDLRSKSDIAAELGYRDMVIGHITEENKRLLWALQECIDELEQWQSDYDDFESEEFIVAKKSMLSELVGE